MRRSFALTWAYGLWLERIKEMARTMRPNSEDK